MWAEAIVDGFILGGDLEQYGIRPRSVAGLSGVALAPFLHDGLGHVAANTLPFFILGGLIVVRSWRDFFVVTALVMAIGGLGVWILAPSQSIHIGASGLVFGYFGYLLLRGFFERSVWSIVAAALAAVLYGGLLGGLLPTTPGVSWQGHLFGFVGGAIAAQISRRRHRSS